MIKYFSMFTGVGGFELGIGNKGECVGFSEWDKHCNKLLQDKYPGIRNYGDCTQIKPEELPDFNLLCGGFPCQAFSIAGKRGGFEDTRGTMFFQVARILKIKRPQFILLENVKGLLNHDKGKTFSVILQTLEELGYDVQWMVLNSKFHGVPQNRERVFIIGSLRGEPRPEILPFRESNSRNDEIEKNNEGQETAWALRSRDYKDGTNFIKVIGNLNSDGWEKRHESIRRVYSAEGIAPTSPTGTGGGVIPKIAIPCLTPDRENKRQNGRRFKENGEEMFTLTGQDIHGIVNEDFRIRRLTPLEFERLQGFPDGWTKDFADTTRYKMMGNAVSVPVIKAIISRMSQSFIKLDN